ncbi:MAG TPA: response regulator [Ktedonobacterales bacterium]
MLKGRSGTTYPATALVVDDDAAIRETLYQLLEDEGYKVEQAPDGIVALNTLRATDAQMVVLLDVMMPRLDGLGVLEAVTRDERLAHRHRFVVMTASSGSITATLDELMRKFNIPTLIKPFAIDDLLSKLSEIARDFVQ